MSDQLPSDPEAEHNPFDKFVNNDLDFEGLGDEGGALSSGAVLPGSPADGADRGEPPLRRFSSGSMPSGDWERTMRSGMNGSPFNDDDGGRPLDEEREGTSTPTRAGGFPPLSPRSPFAGRGVFSFPSLDDPRWRRGGFEVVKDLRIHKTPSYFAPGTPGAASNVMVFTNAYRYANKKVRYIENIFPGWSAVHLLWEKPVLGYVNHNEVRLTPQSSRLQEHWSDYLLVACLCLLLLLLVANVAIPTDDRALRDVYALQGRVATLQARIEILEAQLSPSTPPETPR